MFFFKSTTPAVWTSGRSLRLHERLAVSWPYTSLHSDPEKDTGLRHYLLLLVAMSLVAMISLQLPIDGMGGVISTLIVAIIVVTALAVPFIVHGVAMDTLERLQRDPRVRFADMQHAPFFDICFEYRQWVEAGGYGYVLAADHENQLNDWLERHWRDDESYVLKMVKRDMLEPSEVADTNLRCSMDAMVSFYDLSGLPGHEEFILAFEGYIEDLRLTLAQALAADIKRLEYEADTRASHLYVMRRRLSAVRMSEPVV